MIKFKYFFDSNKGTPNEEEVNNWLKNKNIIILNSSLHNGCLAIFYENKHK